MRKLTLILLLLVTTMAAKCPNEKKENVFAKGAVATLGFTQAVATVADAPNLGYVPAKYGAAWKIAENSVRGWEAYDRSSAQDGRSGLLKLRDELLVLQKDLDKIVEDEGARGRVRTVLIFLTVGIDTALQFKDQPMPAHAEINKSIQRGAKERGVKLTGDQVGILILIAEETAFRFINAGRANAAAAKAQGLEALNIAKMTLSAFEVK